MVGGGHAAIAARRKIESTRILETKIVTKEVKSEKDI